MVISVNEHTNSRMISKPGSKAFDEGYDRIFKKHKYCEHCGEIVAQGSGSSFDGDIYHVGCLEDMFQEELGGGD